jgi:hypothetical protein
VPLQPTRSRLGAVREPLHPTRSRQGVVREPLHPTRSRQGVVRGPVYHTRPSVQLASSQLMTAAPGLGGEPRVGRGLAVSL